LQENGVSANEEGIDVEIKKNIDLIFEQDDKLFPKVNEEFTGVRFPDFNLSIPNGFTADIYVKIVKKIYACIRFKVYYDIRQIIRSQYNDASSTGPKGVTQDQMKAVLKKIDVW